MTTKTTTKDKGMKITLRQAEVLGHLKHSKVVYTGCDGSVLESLRKKGLVLQHFNAGGGTAIYYTWTLTQEGRRLLDEPMVIQ